MVTGLSEAGADAVTIATGSLALVIGFGLWWIYFDLVGRRLPRGGRGTVWTWMLSHLPIQLSIVGVGAGIVSLVEHSHDAATPGGTALLLGGSVAIGLVALIVTERSLEVARRCNRNDIGAHTAQPGQLGGHAEGGGGLVALPAREAQVR